jgi:hypothetical protein
LRPFAALRVTHECANLVWSDLEHNTTSLTRKSHNSSSLRSRIALCMPTVGKSHAWAL